MSYDVKKSSECPDSKPWACFKTTTGEVMGCHATEAGAMEQMKALYANEPGMGRSDESQEEIRLCDLIEFRSLDGDKGPIIQGHAAVFNTKSHDMGFREIIRPGAFTEAVKRDDVKLLINHEGLPLARTKSGTLSLTEDSKGLAFRSELDGGDPDVQRIVPKLKRGDLSEMSFAFKPNKEAGEKVYFQGNELVRELLSVSLFDISVVTHPAYPATDVGLRSRLEKKIAELRQNDAASLERQKARNEFLSRRISLPPINSLAEILRHARKSTQ